MQKVDHLLHRVFSHPTYARLHERACFQRLKKALPETLRRGILFMYVRNGTLFFALRHPAYKMEFDYKLPMIKSLLSTIPPLKEACQDHEIRQIRTFVSKFAPKPAARASSEPRYKERATGRFQANVRDETLRRLFEEITETVIRNRQ